MLSRVLNLIRKELLAVLLDPKSRFAILIPPLIQLFIFAYAATLDVKNAPIGILNRDNGKESQEIIQRFRGSPFFTKILYLDTVSEITPFLDEQKGVMVVSFDEQFSRNVKAGKPAEVQIILDGRKSNTAQIVSGYVQSIIAQYGADLGKGRDVHLVPRNWFNPNLIYLWYNIPSLFSTLAMMTCLIVTTQSVARERELGTLDQLLVSPLTPTEIVIGKIIPGILVGILEGTLLLLVGTLLFKVPFHGSLFLLYFSLLLFVAAISGIGLFISSVSATQQQAMLGSFVTIMPSILLSGFATPIENMPVWLQPFTYLIPLTYMLKISKGLFLKALPAADVFMNLWPVVLIALFNIIGAGLFFRRRLQ
ncbi:ABC transporter permease [Estrella lausannensis]|uniref:Inner membrane transport permease YbhR n=1 Tax=Estrella lausannensis TaxID=483423 RepID=A0A0H5DPW4_9BACT|nr:ABC transporter permease [Estrella lausannensis]CRX38631.1 Inner membrane transport permease YbhR [Estrella lausannensis]